MGVEITYCVNQDGTWLPGPETERVASADEFLVLAYAFGLVLLPIRNLARTHPDAALRERIAFGVEGFERYLAEHHEEGTARFHGYYEFVQGIVHQMRTEGRPEFQGETAIDHLPLEDIDPDAQAFFGALMLAARVVTPEEAAQLNPILGLALGMFGNYAKKYREEDANLAEILTRSRECLAVVAHYFDQAVAERKRVWFSA